MSGTLVIYETLFKLKIKLQSNKLTPNLVMLKRIPSSAEKTRDFSVSERKTETTESP